MEEIRAWLNANDQVAPWMIWGAIFLIAALAYVITRYFIARGLIYLAQRSENKYDDILVARLRLYRLSWIAPALVLYYFAPLLTGNGEFIQLAALFFILWLVAISLNDTLNAINDIYEKSPYYRGVSIQGYLDLLKIFIIATAFVLTISIFTGKPVGLLLAGLGAVMAVLILVFQNTLLSFVASLQIQSNDLVKEGDWIEVPEYDADGDVLNINLHAVKVRNWDNTITVVPTYKLVETPYKNWRGMQESGGRRIKRAIHIDLNSIKFCDRGLIQRLENVDLIKDYIEAHRDGGGVMQEADQATLAGSIGSQQFTNISAFRTYVENYLFSRDDLHHEGSMKPLVRQLEPGQTGLPIEVYAFTRKTAWEEYEDIQAEIFDHLIAAVPQFDLRIFQDPSGRDFQNFAESIKRL